MQDSLPAGSTSGSLVAGLRDRNPLAWSRVAHIYAPTIMRWCRTFGLNDADQQDVCQQVLMAVVRHGATFRKDKPGDRFRNWLWKVTRNESIRLAKQTGNVVQSISDLQLSELNSDVENGDDTAEFSAIINRALEVIQSQCREKTWEIFCDVIFSDLPTEMIASRHQTTVENVRIIKLRQLAKLRDLVEMTDDGDVIDIPDSEG